MVVSDCEKIKVMGVDIYLGCFRTRRSCWAQGMDLRNQGDIVNFADLQSCGKCVIDHCLLMLVNTAAIANC